MATQPELSAHLDETRNLNELIRAFMAQVPSFGTPEGLHQLRTAPSAFEGPAVDGVIERGIPGPVGEIPARVIEPDDVVQGVHLDLHGGGWCIGSAQSHDHRNDELSRATGTVVVSIDYRLAPEHPFPAGPDDAEAAASWLIEHASGEWGSDRLTIGGGSAGAHLAALTLVRLRDRLGTTEAPRFCGAVLDAGAYDLSLTPSARGAHDALIIPTGEIEIVLDHFLPGRSSEDRRHPTCSPLFADLTGLPPALFLVGTLDPLLDDSLFMFERWRAAGNRADLAVYPESVHGFAAMPTELAAHARRRTFAFIDEVRSLATN